jgi:hypothetical protein
MPVEIVERAIVADIAGGFSANDLVEFVTHLFATDQRQGTE